MSTDTTAISGTYATDPTHSSFGFAVRAMGVSTFRGTFDSVTAMLDAGPGAVALTGTAEVESISIRTPEQFRAHVLGEQFFDAGAHPQVTFSSNHVVLGDDGAVTVSGALTIRGITRPVTAHGTWTAPAVDPMGRTRSHLALQSTINRRDYGMTWDAPLPNGGSGLGDEVTITAELALVAKE